MVKINKKKVNFESKKKSPLLNPISEGEKEMLRIKKIKERIRIKKFQDINGMEITHDIFKKKI